ncbi:MAG: hypothetical protein HQK60_16465 [Deltaproteobacteria bacterium]|nr:hypothetical protein [Deltaproteobacteria bacterium]
MVSYVGRAGPIPANHVAVSAGEIDANGKSHSYTFANQFGLVKSIAVSNAVNGLGQRVSKTGASAAYFVYDEVGQDLLIERAHPFIG